MKRQFVNLMMAGFLVLSLGACKKNSSDDATPTSSNSTATTQADDDARISDAINSVANEADEALNGSSLGGRVDGSITCDATITDSSQTNKRTITYSGSCQGTKYNRTGTVTVQLIPASVGGKWRDAGSKILVTFKDVTVTRKSDGKSHTINGTLTHTNVTGGTVFTLSTATASGSVQHKVRGTLNVTFGGADSSTTATWVVTRTRTWNKTNGAVTLVLAGDSSNALVSNIYQSGTNRRGKPFYSTSSGVTIANCGTATQPVYLALGEVKHYYLAGTLTIKYGATDNAGTLASSPCSGKGTYVNWERNLPRESFSAYYPY